MTLGFVVSSLNDEFETDTTPFLVYNAWQMGHKVFYIEINSFCTLVNGSGGAYCKGPGKEKFRNLKSFLSHIKEDSVPEKISFDELDVLFMRANPLGNESAEIWRHLDAINFSYAAEQSGALVINHPLALYYGIMDKLYFEQYPKPVKPASLITRNAKDVQQFIKSYNKVVLKPLAGSAGSNVFLVDGDSDNINQIIETITKSGYLVAQEFLKQGEKGDLRVFMINGKLFEIEGKVAAVRRIHGKGDFRNNIHAGGSASKAVVPESVHSIAEAVSPKLIEDGIFLAGLDIVGDKVIEVNILSPGGINVSSFLEEVNFGRAVIQSIEQKVMLKKLYGRRFSNKELAVM